MKMKRLPTQYRNCNANAIASGSKAQMMYFIEDAKADIDTLIATNSDLMEALKAIRRHVDHPAHYDKWVDELCEAAIQKADQK